MSRVTISMHGHLFPGATAAMSQPGGVVYLAVDHAAKTLGDRARQFVYSPFDRVDTTYMAESIHHEMQNETEATALVGSDAFYDIYQHEGTSRGIKPAPFMTQALYDLHEDDFRAT
jgi:hypothetical protein